MNIAISVNKKFIIPLKVMLFSLYKNNKDKNVTFNIFFLNSDLDKKELSSLKAFVHRIIHGRFFVIDTRESSFSDFVTDMFSIEAYNRLLLPYILPEKIKKILWLDADMIVKGKIVDFYNTDINDHYLLATKSALPNDNSDRKKELGIPMESTYFNSGVILLNLRKIRSEIPKSTMLEYIVNNSSKLKYFDQDVLNVLLGNNALLFEQDIFDNLRHLDKENNLTNAKIIHYITFMKPWKYYYQGYGDRYFWSYAGKCGFKTKKILYDLIHPFGKIIYKLYLVIRY